MFDVISASFDLLNNNFAGFIASLAFLAAALQAHSAHRQNCLSVRPYLHVSFDKDEKGNSLVVKLHNAGLGPAIIEDFYIKHENKVFRSDKIIQAFERNLALKFNIQNIFLNPGFALAAADSLEILKVRLDDMDKDFETVQSYLDENFQLIVKYKSFQNERTTYNSTDAHQWNECQCEYCKSSEMSLPG